MAENMFSPQQKAVSDEYRQNYDRIEWDVTSDRKTVGAMWPMSESSLKVYRQSLECFERDDDAA